VIELQWRAGVRRYLGHVFEVLPVHAAPGDARVHFFDGDLAELGLDVGGSETHFVEPGSRFDAWGKFAAPVPLTPALSPRRGGNVHRRRALLSASFFSMRRLAASSP